MQLSWKFTALRLGESSVFMLSMKGINHTFDQSNEASEYIPHQVKDFCGPAFLTKQVVDRHICVQYDC